MLHRAVISQTMVKHGSVAWHCIHRLHLKLKAHMNRRFQLITISSIFTVAFYGAVMYGPRCDGYQWMVITPHADSNLLLANRQQKVKELREVIKRRQPALFLTLILVALFLTPFRVIALVVIVFGLYYLVNDLLYHM